MKKLLKIVALAAVALSFVGNLSATYYVTPLTQPRWEVTISPPTVANVLAWMQTTVGPVDSLYRRDPADFPPSIETGPYSLNYTTRLAPFGDATGGTITWDGRGAIVDYEKVYLLVKDSSGIPSVYLFDISNWDGKETIDLSGFWAAAKGSIVHISIHGTGHHSPVPDGGTTVALLGLAFAGLGAGRRFIKR